LAKEHFLAWWEGEAFGRCALGITAPRATPLPVPEPDPPQDPLQRWTDLDYIAALNEYRHATTYYGGESFPIWDAGYSGATSIAVYLGCPITLDLRTGWIDPILTSDDWDVTSLHIDPENRWWKFAQTAVERCLVEAPGKSVPSVGAFGGCGDTLSMLRGTMRLLYDVALVPDRVREAELCLMDMWVDVFEALYSPLKDVAEGSTCFFNLWSPGRFYCTHNDFSYMISEEMFRSLFVPALERQTEYLDHTVYHVDGISAFRHVPVLLELPRIQAFQVLPGAGKPSPLQFLDTLRMVQENGRNLHISIEPDEVETALDLLSARGLFISTHCESEEHARHLLARAERWSHD
jgi:hypothetical protein